MVTPRPACFFSLHPMASGPDTSMTAQDMLVRIAEAGGVADYTNPDDATDSRARVPSNSHDLDRCWRALNDAAAELAARHRWQCLNVRTLIAVDASGESPAAVSGNPGIYALPWYLWDVVPAEGWILYESSPSDASRVVMTTLSRVRAELVASSGSTGRPVWATAQPASHVASGRRGWDLHIAPLPDRSYTLECQTRIAPRKMAAMSDRHVFGAKHDMTLLALAKWMFHRDRRADAETVAMLKAEAEQAIATSIRNDGEDTPATIGCVYDPSIRYEDANSNRYDVYLNGTQYV